MLFLLIFILTNSVYSQLYENTAEARIPPSTISTVQPCLIENTEHFVKKSNVQIPGKISLSSSKIIQTIVDHYLFLISLDKDILWSKTSKKWYIKLSFQKIHEYTQLEFDDLSSARDACHPFLIIKKNASMVCQYDGAIRFTKDECARIIKRLVRNPPFVRTSMNDMQDDIV